jgi:hypothetical protein
VDLAGADGEVHPVQDRLLSHAGVEITDLKQNRGVGADHDRCKGRGTGWKRQVEA